MTHPLAPDRRQFLGTTALGGVGLPAPAAPAAPAMPGPALEMRVCVEQLRNPYWYEDHGQPDEVRAFWDRAHWGRVLKAWADDGYNAVLYWPEPWTETAWPSFLIGHAKFPEARELTPEQAGRITGHVRWVFAKAHELGLKNFLFDYQAVTTRAFARARGLDRELPVSAT